MSFIHASGLDHKALNEAIRQAGDDCTITECRGQRFIAAGMSGKTIEICGIPGNALAAYLNGATIVVRGNAQDAVGDTMNDGTVIVHGNIGDAAGYAMRGGKIYVRGNAGYRSGIHMKAYQDKFPVIVIGGRAGSFLGEYQAGGLIIVLNLQNPDGPIVGHFPCTGMHGGKMFLRSDCQNVVFPEQVTAKSADGDDLQEISPYIRAFCEQFGYDPEQILSSPFTVVTPDTQNPYKRMYVPN
ncbi:MAG: glutamate synthase [Clostridia bacterium]|nr:glutamate synthase [Clostridia bacterium]